jgi:hypothetical protein
LLKVSSNEAAETFARITHQDSPETFGRSRSGT